jgi:hypothetical protein
LHTVASPSFLQAAKYAPIFSFKKMRIDKESKQNGRRKKEQEEKYNTICTNGAAAF